MRIATWNVERLKHHKDLNVILQEIEAVSADILVLTETDNRINPAYPYAYATPLMQESVPECYKNTENRVTIFSKYPLIRLHETCDRYTAICAELSTESGNLLVYGTIMGVYGNRDLSFLPDLKRQMEDIRRLTGQGYKICVAGDYNLSFCDNYYYTKDGRALVEQTFTDCRIELLTRNLPECVDHIAVSSDFRKGDTMSVWEWNDDKRLSDHKGTAVDIGKGV